MLSIWKYNVEPAAFTQFLMVPEGSEVISCGTDAEGMPSIWVLVDTNNAPTKPMEYYVVGTGWNLDFMKNRGLMFLGTIKDGPYMWHVFVGDES